MMNDSDSLQIVIGLAKDSGRIEEQNNSLREELTDVKSQLATVSSENATQKKIIEELRESNKDKDATIILWLLASVWRREMAVLQSIYSTRA